MLFARVRWIGRVLDEAGIDTNSALGKELTSTLVVFSKYCQEKNRRGDGASGIRLKLSPAEWALLAGILSPAEPRVEERLAGALDLSTEETSSVLARIADSALKLARKKMPDVVASMASGPDDKRTPE